MQQVQRAGDVGVDDVPRLAERLVEEAVAQSVARVGDQQVDRPAGDRQHQLVDAERGRQVGLDGIDVGAQRAQRRSRFLERPLVGGDDQVMAVLRGQPGELAADAGRGAGDDGERTSGIHRGHGFS